ncbi:extracellular solute-binding protein [Paenibacillus sanguinis]|uniref:extracellular solute-binding protein n=1 Tax=Paenibacillus sanguinis TaxID=225906 RepID=UPI00036C11A6|nr:extracellular solute-binding protein [Paenibacillus sanguinis]
MLNKKGWSGVLSVVMCTLWLAGCGGNGDGSSSSKIGNASSGPASNIQLEVAQISWGASLPQNDFLKAKLDEELNMDLKQTLVGDMADYESQINVRAASNNLPDLFMVSTKAHLQKLADSGMLLDLQPYVEKMPDYMALAGENVLKKGIVGGKQYALPKSGESRNHTYWIRKDWLDNLGLPMPKTVDELLQTAVAFTNHDPDGNSKADTFGITGSGLQAFEMIFGANGMTSGTGMTQFYLENNKVVNPFYEPEMVDALTQIKAFVDAGVVDPEVINNKGTMAKDKAFQGKVGIINIDWAQMIKDDQVAVWKTANPDAEWIQLGAIEGPRGEKYANPINIGAASGLWAVPKRLENEPEKLNKVLELFNYVSTKEGNLMVLYGLEGEHFTLADDQVTITEKGTQEAGFTWLYQFSGREETDYLKTKFSNISEYIDFEAELPRIENLDGFVEYPPGYNNADAARYIEEELIKFIYGKRDLSEYNEFLSTLEGSFGYKAFVQSATEQLNNLGYGQ